MKLMAPQYVKPYVKTNKNDLRDAEAIAEAVTRPSMRFVPIKDIHQQDIQALHRVRERLIGARTALINEMRKVIGGIRCRPAQRTSGVSPSRDGQTRSRTGQAHSDEPDSLPPAL